MRSTSTTQFGTDFRSRMKTAREELEAAGRLLTAAPNLLPVGYRGPAALLERNAQRFGDRPALAFEHERYGWSEVDAWANRYAQLFARQGIKAGDAVALMMDNRPDLLFAELGLNKIGAVSALINTHLRHHPLAHAINASRARAALVGSEHAGAVKEVIDQLEFPAHEVRIKRDRPDDDPHGLDVVDERLRQHPPQPPEGRHRTSTSDPQSYIYTSGTTGLPKAAIVTNKRFLLAASFFGRVLHEASPDDVIYVALPMYHGNGQWGGLASCLLTGAQLALRRRFSASRFWDDVNAFGATRFVYIGEMCRYLLDQPERDNERTHNIRVAIGNGLQREVWERFQERFDVPLIREFYGATEGNAPMFNVQGRPGMIGRLKPAQVLVRCDLTTGELVRNGQGFCDEVDEGETGLLLGRITAVTGFDGYVDESATEKKIVRDVFKKGDAFFNSGDLLTLHDNRWVSFADRVGDTFRWKGENVSTREVSEALERVEGVLEANVYGVQVPGTEGRAGMAALRTDNTFDLDDLAQYVLTELPRFQWPWFVRIQNEMQVTGTFKHRKVDYRKEGFDPSKVDEPLYFLDGEKYVALDQQLYKRILNGEVAPG